jgi:class 3 adenylate cyclase
VSAHSSTQPELPTLGDGIGGIAVHIGARIAALAAASEVWVSSPVRDLTVGSGLGFVDAGTRPLKGVPDSWHLFKLPAVDHAL